MKNKLLSVLLAFSFLSFVSIDAKDYSKLYENTPVTLKQVSEPQIPNNSVDITTFGAKPDGVTLNTEAFANAIDALVQKGGGHLNVPAGVWLTGPIELKNNIDLHLDKNALVIMTPEKRAFLKPRKDGKSDRAVPAISATKCHDIAITGEGTIDGNGKYWRPVKHGKVSDVEWSAFTAMGGTVNDKGDLWMPYGLKHFENITATPEKEESLRADLVRFTNCKNVMVSGVKIQNSPRFHLHPVQCQNVIIDGVTVRCPWNAQNGDAIDISNCRAVLIANTIVDAGDDGLCMKSGVGESGVKQGPCEDILITDDIVYHAHGGFVIGSDDAGGMKNIVVRNCTFSGTDTGLRFKSAIGRGGKTENIFISDIVMNDIKDEAVTFSCDYADKSYNKDNATASADVNLPFAPEFTDIHINNVVCRECKTAIAASGIAGLKCVHDIEIKNSVFFYIGKKSTIIDEKTADVQFDDVKLLTY